MIDDRFIFTTRLSTSCRSYTYNMNELLSAYLSQVIIQSWGTPFTGGDCGPLFMNQVSLVWSGARSRSIQNCACVRDTRRVISILAVNIKSFVLTLKFKFDQEMSPIAPRGREAEIQ